MGICQEAFKTLHDRSVSLDLNKKLLSGLLKKPLGISSLGSKARNYSAVFQSRFRRILTWRQTYHFVQTFR